MVVPFFAEIAAAAAAAAVVVVVVAVAFPAVLMLAVVWKLGMYVFLLVPVANWEESGVAKCEEVRAKGSAAELADLEGLSRAGEVHWAASVQEGEVEVEEVVIAIPAAVNLSEVAVGKAGWESLGGTPVGAVAREVGLGPAANFVQDQDQDQDQAAAAVAAVAAAART